MVYRLSLNFIQEWFGTLCLSNHLLLINASDLKHVVQDSAELEQVPGLLPSHG